VISKVSSAEGGPMARYGRLLTDAQWEKIRPCSRNEGNAPRADDRLPTTAKVLEGILWILRSGARWCDLPVEFSLAFDLLAATARLGGARGLVRNLAHVPE